MEGQWSDQLLLSAIYVDISMGLWCLQLETFSRTSLPDIHGKGVFNITELLQSYHIKQFVNAGQFVVDKIFA